MPSMKWRWKAKKTAIIGIAATAAPVMSIPKSVLNSPCSVASPTWTGYFAGSRRMTSGKMKAFQ